MAAGALTLLLWAYTYFFPRGASLQLQPLPTQPGPQRLLIIAPHEDDETLAAAGLIQQVEAAGGQAYVCFITAGDGFTLAADLAERRLYPDRPGMLELGRIRHDEALSALAALKVPPDHALFLGFPDGSITPLWLDAFHVPLQSPKTGERRVPYAFALHPGVPYTGEALLSELRGVLTRIQPTLILIPHPLDAHPDHWATHNFAAAALYAEQAHLSPKVYSYLVHRGDWPAPKGLLPHERLLPPANLTFSPTDWTERELSPAQVAGKEQAIRLYKSQIAILHRFLLSFARRTEFVGVVPVVTLKPEAAPTTLTLDPRGDTIARRLAGNADITALSAGIHQGRLELTLSLRQPPSGRIRYELDLRTYRPDHGWRDGGAIHVTPGGTTRLTGNLGSLTPQQITATSSGHDLVVSLPLAALGNPTAFGANARTWEGSIRVDQSAWQIATLLH